MSPYQFVHVLFDDIIRHVESCDVICQILSLAHRTYGMSSESGEFGDQVRQANQVSQVSLVSQVNLPRDFRWVRWGGEAGESVMWPQMSQVSLLCGIRWDRWVCRVTLSESGKSAMWCLLSLLRGVRCGRWVCYVTSGESVIWRQVNQVSSLCDVSVHLSVTAGRLWHHHLPVMWRQCPPVRDWWGSLAPPPPRCTRTDSGGPPQPDTSLRRITKCSKRFVKTKLHVTRKV